MMSSKKNILAKKMRMMALPEFKQLFETSKTISSKTSNKIICIGHHSNFPGLIKNALSRRESKLNKISEGALPVEM